ncbi:hypothetical protein [Novosphingobium terrae]|uniref:hypothetical protein n=1 Tax=Novosphingobium terrae TaxID=2726189 RepID=UPI0019826655|nr:hypothetical protein [Novosphingobium terrae]
MARLARIDTFGVDLPAIRPHNLAMAALQASSSLTRDHGNEARAEAATIRTARYGDKCHHRLKPLADTYIRQSQTMPAQAPRLPAASASHDPLRMRDGLAHLEPPHTFLAIVTAFPKN